MRKSILVMAWLAALTMACSTHSSRQATEKFAADYASISQKYAGLTRTISARLDQAKSKPDYLSLMKEYNRIQNSHKGELETLLRQHEGSPANDDQQLLRGRILIELSRYAEADKLLDGLINRGSPQTSAAKLEKVKITIISGRLNEALTLFRKIEPLIAHDIQYYSFAMVFATQSADVNVRREFSGKIISAKDLPAEMEARRPQIYANLAIMAWRSNEIERAREILNQALAISREPRMTQTLQARLKQLELIGQPAPAWTADVWLNGKPLNLSACKGRVVVLDFGPPGASPAGLSCPAWKNSLLPGRSAA